MTEKEVKSEVVKDLKKGGWTYWTPPNIKFYQRDIFGVFDLIALRAQKVRLIQYTTKTHLSHRRNKIKLFFQENAIHITFAYVYAYDKKNKKLIKEKIRNEK